MKHTKHEFDDPEWVPDEIKQPNKKKRSDDTSTTSKCLIHVRNDVTETEKLSKFTEIIMAGIIQL